MTETVTTYHAEAKLLNVPDWPWYGFYDFPIDTTEESAMKQIKILESDGAVLFRLVKKTVTTDRILIEF